MDEEDRCFLSSHPDPSWSYANKVQTNQMMKWFRERMDFTKMISNTIYHGNECESYEIQVDSDGKIRKAARSIVTGIGGPDEQCSPAIWSCQRQPSGILACSVTDFQKEAMLGIQMCYQTRSLFQ